MATQSILTVEDFLKSPEYLDEKRRFELRNGEIVEMAEPTVWHDYMRDRVVFCINGFADPRELGMALSERAFYVDSNNYCRGDVVFWDAEHWKAVADDPDTDVIRVIPQLVVEIVSPSERDAHGKAADYIRAGVHTVWLVFRRPFEVNVFEASGGRRVVRAGERLEAPTLLPGFSEDPARFRLTE